MRELRRLLAGLGRETRRIARAETPTHRQLRDRLLTAAIATLVVDIAATLAIFLLERHAPNTDITTIGSAFFWTTTQLLTVSSSLHNPISSSARAIDVVLELYALTVVTALAGSFGAFFHRRGLERDPIDPRPRPHGSTDQPRPGDPGSRIDVA
jgi:hypothetical protein